MAFNFSVDTVKETDPDKDMTWDETSRFTLKTHQTLLKHTRNFYLWSKWQHLKIRNFELYRFLISFNKEPQLIKDNFSLRCKINIFKDRKKSETMLM